MLFLIDICFGSLLDGNFSQDEIVSLLKSSTPPVYISVFTKMSQMTEEVEAKDMGLIAPFYDLTIMSPVTKLIDLPKSNNGTTSEIFKKINTSLWSSGLLYG